MTHYDPQPIIAIFNVLVAIFAIGSYVVSSVALAYLYKRMGIEPWKAWVPVYSTWVFLEQGGFRGFWSLLPVLSIIPVIGFFAGLAGFILVVVAAFWVGKSFGKENPLWVVLYVLCMPVWCAILAFDGSVYDASKKPAIRF